MADLNITPDQIAKAREAGYSDDEIVNHLSTKAPEKFKGALDAGYSPTEILAHFGADAKTAPQPTTAPAPEAETPPHYNGMLRELTAGAFHGVNEMIRGTQSSRKNIMGEDVDDSPRDPDYKPANVTNGSWNPLKWNGRQIPRMVGEMAPIAATSAAGAALGELASPVGAIAGGLAPFAITSAGDNVKARAVARTGDKNAVPNDEDKAIGIGTSLAAAVPGSIMHTPALGNAVGAGLNGVGKAVTNLLTRGGVGAVGGVAQNAITQAGTKIGTDQPFDPSQLPEAAVGGAASATPHILPAVAASARALRMGKYNADPEAAANYATRLQNTGLDLANIHEAAQAHQKVMADTHGELKAALDKVVQQKALSPEETNAVASIRRGDTITPKDMEHLTTATAGAPDGANAHFLARALNTAQQAQGEGSFDPKTGWQGSATGGMKNVVRGVFNPWHIGGTMAGLGALAFGMPHVSGAVGGGLMGGLGIGLGGARLLDSITGGSRPADSFAKTFADHNAQLRMGTTPPPQQPPPIPQAPNSPWGPRPPSTGPTGPQVAPTPGAPQMPWGPKPLAQQSVPQVQPPQLPQPLPQGNMPWKAPQATELPKFSPMQLAMLKKQIAASTAQANAPEPTPAPPAPPPPAPPPNLGIGPMQLAALKKQMAATTAQANAPAPAAPAAPAPAPTPAPMNPLMLPRDITGPAKNIVKGISSAKDMQDEATKPAVSAIPAAAMKISKSKGGEVKATDPYADAGSFQPVPDDRMVYKGLTPDQIGDKVARERPELPEMNRMGLRNAVTQTHAARDAVNADLISQLPQHAAELHSLGEQLKEPGNSDIQYSRRVIQHYTSKMDPASAQIVKQRYLNERENLWPTAAEKKAAARKKAAAKKED